MLSDKRVRRLFRAAFGLLLVLFCLLGEGLQAQVGGSGVAPNRRDPMLQPPPQQEGEVQQEQGGRGKKLIDDSTKMVFGPKTALHFFEKDIRRNRKKLHEVDTLLTGFHYYEPVARSGWKYQDLGNIGTAAKPIFYEAPQMIGLTSGFHVYDLYMHSVDSVRYYDTKSPFTDMNVYFGGGHRNMLDLAFARNVNERWNVGLVFHTIRSRRTLNPRNRDDHQTVQNSYGFNTNYTSEDGKYLLLASFTRVRHLVNEQGGIIPQAVDSTSLPFAYEDAQVWLRQAQATDLRQEVKLFHQYELLQDQQVYHSFDRRKQEVFFAAPLTTPQERVFFDRFHPERFNRADSTLNFNRFVAWTNEFGVKGDIGPLFYTAFGKFRFGQANGNFQLDPFRFNELSVGGMLRGELSEKWRFEAEGEYLFPEAYRLHGLFISPFLEASYTSARYRPTAQQLIFRGNHHRWVNDFSNIQVDQVKGVLKADFKRFSLRPNLTLRRVSNFVFFDQEQQARQATGEAVMLIPGLKAGMNLGGKFYMDVEGYYTVLTGGGADNFRIPELFANFRTYYDTPLFDDNLFLQIGFEVRYRSDNFADAYSPALQQFHLQDDFNVFAYAVVDAFVNLRINRTRLLFRYNHLNQNMMEQPGYFVTPGYTGMRGFLDLGISWPLFD
ncbi:MAG: putative porin [Nitritalea sp.]